MKAESACCCVAEHTSCKLVHEGCRDAGGEVEVEGVIEACCSIRDNALHSLLVCLYKVDGRCVWDGIPLGLQGEMEGDAVLPELVDTQQRSYDRSCEGVQYQDLVVLFISRLPQSVRGSVQV